MVLAAVCIILGAFLLSWVMLPYDTEENRIDDVLIEWWVAADDASKSSRLQTATLAVGSWFSDLFGANLLSWKAVAVSACLSTSSVLLFISFGSALLWQLVAGEQQSVTATVLSAITLASGLPVSIGLFLTAMRVSRGQRPSSSALEFGFFTMCFFALMLILRPAIAFGIAVFIFGWILVGAVAHVMVIALARAAITWATVRNTIFPTVMAVVIPAILSVAMFVLPFWAIGQRPGSPWAVPLFFLGAGSMYAVAGAVGSLAISAAFVLSRMFWPLLARILYNLHRFGVLRQRRFLFFCGTALLGVAAPHVARVLLGAAELVPK